MRHRRLGFILLVIALLSAGSALGDDSVTKTTVWNGQSSTTTVYWRAVGCAGVVDGRVGVCYSTRVEPGRSASYTWLWGQTAKGVTASCKDMGWSATAEGTITNSCDWKNGPLNVPPVKAMLVNKVSGLCLDPAGYDAASGTNVGLYKCDGGLDQVFMVDSFTGEFSTNAKSGVCLDAAGYEGNVGDKVGLYTCEGKSDQRWFPWTGGPFPTGWIPIKNMMRGNCLQAEGDAKTGANVQLADCDIHAGTDRQLWSFVLIP